MTHNMKDNDKALSVRTPMWHAAQTDSVTLASAPTRAEAESRVSAYQVIREPLFRRELRVKDTLSVPPEFEEVYIEYEEEQLNVRSDTGTVFGSVNTDRIDPQPAEVWDLADAIMTSNKDVVIETAGTYNDGADLYILLKLDEMFQIKGDPNGASYSYTALQNAWYKGKALRCQLTNVRIQCNNTSTAADMIAEAGNVNLSLAHTLNMRERMEEIEHFMANWREGIDAWREAKEFMATQKVSTEQTNWFIETFINAPADQLTSQRVKDNVETSRIALIGELFNGYNQGIIGTSLGLFEAASSYAGHVRAAHTPMTRFKRAMLTPDNVLQDAARLALEAANV